MTDARVTDEQIAAWKEMAGEERGGAAKVVLMLIAEVERLRAKRDCLELEVEGRALNLKDMQAIIADRDAQLHELRAKVARYERVLRGEDPAALAALWDALTCITDSDRETIRAAMRAAGRVAGVVEED